MRVGVRAGMWLTCGQGRATPGSGAVALAGATEVLTGPGVEVRGRVESGRSEGSAGEISIGAGNGGTA